MKQSYQFLRPIKATTIEQLTAKMEDRSGKLDVSKYRDCLVYPHYIQSKKLLSTKTISLPEHISQGAVLQELMGGGILSDNFDETIQFSGRTLYGGYFRPHWGHFLVNTMGRIWPMFTTLYSHFDQIVFFADSPHYSASNIITALGRNFEQFIQLADLEGKIKIINKPAIFEELIVPENSIVRFQHYSKEYMLVMEKVKENALKNKSNLKYPKKIFFTRTQLKKSEINEINGDVLDNFFRDNGFDIISPEKISLIELINYMAHAEHIASICGTLAHNFVFAPKGCQLTIIERHPFINISQQMISKSSGSNPDLIDANLMPMQSDSVGALFLYQYTKQFQDWVISNNYVPPKFVNTENGYKKEIKKYLKRYRQLYGYSPYYNEWDKMYGAIYSEACLDSTHLYAKWLRRKSPLLTTDYFSIRCYPDLGRRLYNILLKLRLR